MKVEGKMFVNGGGSKHSLITMIYTLYLTTKVDIMPKANLKHNELKLSNKAYTINVLKLMKGNKNSDSLTQS